MSVAVTIGGPLQIIAPFQKISLLSSTDIGKYPLGRVEPWCKTYFWYTGPAASRTHTKHTYPVSIQRPHLLNAKLESRKYRNPVIYAKELHDEMVRDDLTRKQLAERHGVSSDRITQWLCILKLPKEKLNEIEALGDYWDKQIVTERELRAMRKSGKLAITRSRSE